MPAGVLPAILADQCQDEIAVLQRRKDGNGGKIAAVILAVRIGHIRFVIGRIAFKPCTFEGAHRKEQIVGGCILEHLENIAAVDSRIIFVGNPLVFNLTRR